MLRPVLSAAALLALAACGQPDAAQTDAAAPAQGEVARTTAEAPAPVAPSAPSAAIQTQDGPEGSRVSLTRAQVTGDILTVQLRYEKTTDPSLGARFSVEEVNVVDDATAQRYGVLRDQEQRWQASPLQSPTSDYTLFSARIGAPAVVWFKFPAPPATSKTVSINIPGVGPFDGVTVQR